MLLLVTLLAIYSQAIPMSVGRLKVHLCAQELGLGTCCLRIDCPKLTKQLVLDNCSLLHPTPQYIKKQMLISSSLMTSCFSQIKFCSSASLSPSEVCLHRIARVVAQSMTVEDLHFFFFKPTDLWPDREGQLLQRALEVGTQEVNAAVPVSWRGGKGLV